MAGIGSKTNIKQVDNDSVQSTRLASQFEADDIKLIRYESKNEGHIEPDSKA